MALTHKKTTEVVLAEIKKYHKELLYDKFSYTNSHTKVTIGCNIHGYFEKYPNDMKNGRGGCPKCNNSYQKLHSEFIDELCALYPYIKCNSIYINAHTKLEFDCITHNYKFKMAPYTILAGHVGCPECYSSKQTQTKVVRGQISDPLLKPEYELYRTAVWRFSNRSFKKYMIGQIRDRHNHLDHILSIVDGFKYKVPAEILGSICNLRIICGQVNRKKSYRSDITVEQLLERYNNEKIILHGS